MTYQNIDLNLIKKQHLIIYINPILKKKHWKKAKKLSHLLDQMSEKVLKNLDVSSSSTSKTKHVFKLFISKRQFLNKVVLV